VISESKIRPAGAENGYFEAPKAATGLGFGQRAWNKLACVVPAGREYWRIIDREPNNIKGMTD
jgi:hypothetical protein